MTPPPEPMLVLRFDTESVRARGPADYRTDVTRPPWLEEALAAEGGNQSRAAARLGISERALRYKLAKHRGA